MRKFVVGRPVGGITINEELEFLSDDEGKILYLDGITEAEKYMREHGIDAEEMRHMKFLASCGTCFRCGAPLFPSLLPGYKYQCFECDEDFYSFEQKGED